jgi:LysR family hydrogen peroxide-inducible transcriptional activator
MVQNQPKRRKSAAGRKHGQNASRELALQITIKHLRFLLALADKLHFRRAAESVHVTQPTMSGQIRELEERLGIQLVERSRSQVTLTPIGKKVVARARIVLREMEALVDLAKASQSLFDGIVRVGVVPTLGPYLLPHILPGLRRQHPDLKLYVREGMPQSLRRDLEDGKLDVILYPLPIYGADIQSVPLFREPLWIAVPGDHRLARKNRISRCDLKGEVVLALEHGHRLHEQVHSLCEEYEAEVSIDFEGTSLDTLRQMVEMGIGIAFLPSLYVISEIREGDQIAVRKLDCNPPNRLIGMVWRKQSSMHDQYTTLADMTRNILREGVPEVMAVQ